ncbi:histone deacetylase family protein [Acidisoma cellulosilytica]|uniref:Histone deacetylase family protein n=1 Tax=Acidisoma cellulosilyticum TaxID=2802395 RepID=A0A963Z5U2_9PROT|nr:histone deacetylase family protein [Acidisoma cellulosilyticum]MCB8882402.1 histone deacetylase family protein [Acidisoma cellulosilyticum]
MSLLLLTHPSSLAHDTGPGHPERIARLKAVGAALAHPDFSALIREEAPPATEAQLRLVHPQSHIDLILSTEPDEGEMVRLDPDTVMSAGSAEAALHGAGGAIAAVDAVESGRVTRAFVATRPPGHHAEPARPMGFCFFSNAAIAALHARAAWGKQRVAVVDFDVHHGNGTQAAAWNDPDFFFGSSHQYPFYPGTGGLDERGIAGQIVNAPLSAGTGRAGFETAWTDRILPALDDFAPDCLIISAGFDAHRDDPLAGLMLDTEDFAWVTDAILALARRHTGGRVVSLLEGGYDLDALAASTAAHVRRLLLAG